MIRSFIRRLFGYREPAWRARRRLTIHVIATTDTMAAGGPAR